MKPWAHSISHLHSQKSAQYDAPHQLEPLLPSELTMAPLLELASDLSRAAVALGTATAAVAQTELRSLLRSMNSYYTNRLEGEHTRPSDIEPALQQDFSAQAEQASQLAPAMRVAPAKSSQAARLR